MITLGTQYYRPPFPNSGYWEEDFTRVADSGFNTVQLWVVWAWVESVPGQFDFDDYDRLMDLAGKKGLGVVLSTIAEVQPQWIHRLVPESELVTRLGHKVLSSNRTECNFGLSPGGCTDHPEIWSRMSQFIAATVERYKNHPQLRAWDIWNELRWQVNADDLVCYCPHTIREFRNWLKKQHGDLAGLNRAWLRRYVSWDDVIPGRMSSESLGPFTEMTAFQQFITERANEHAHARYKIAKQIDRMHPITVHGPCSCLLLSGGTNATFGSADMFQSSLWRGNDWAMADNLDGVGLSAFPAWQMKGDDARLAVNIDAVASAARSKRFWLSELQGGRASQGTLVVEPVRPDRQQRWLWLAVSRKAETILFWCWRDEVFGSESGGFGISGNDGFAPARLEAFKHTSSVLRRHEAVFDGFVPDSPVAGVLFSPQAYYHYWVLERKGDLPRDSVLGYARALEVANIPFRYVEESHLDELSGLKNLFLPRTQVIDDATGAKLHAWVEAGGTLVGESECGAYTTSGFYRYPADRLFAKLTGQAELMRIPLKGKHLDIELQGKNFRLRSTQWLTPFGAGPDAAPKPAIMSPVGKGRIVLLGGYFGDAYWNATYGDDPAEDTSDPGQFEELISHLSSLAGAYPAAHCDTAQGCRVLVRTGSSHGRRLLFVFSGPGQDLELRLRDKASESSMQDLLNGGNVERAGAVLRLPGNAWGIHVLHEQPNGA